MFGGMRVFAAEAAASVCRCGFGIKSANPKHSTCGARYLQTVFSQVAVIKQCFARIVITQESCLSCFEFRVQGGFTFQELTLNPKALLRLVGLHATVTALKFLKCPCPEECKAFYGFHFRTPCPTIEV